MSATPYSTANGTFTNSAHALARSFIYPDLFGVEPWRVRWDDDTQVCTSERGRFLDGELGIDRIALVDGDGLKAPLRVTIQERFRRPGYFGRFHDVTITEWNPQSNTPSELYKICADLLLYGEYDQERNAFGQWVAVKVLPVKLWLLTLRDAEIERLRGVNPRSQQPFIGINVDTLRSIGALEEPIDPFAEEE